MIMEYIDKTKGALQAHSLLSDFLSRCKIDGFSVSDDLYSKMKSDRDTNILNADTTYNILKKQLLKESNNNASRYTMVNGYYSTSQNNHEKLSNQDFFASCTGYHTNFSPNMYVFTITSVEGTNYVIGDPRTTEIDTELINAKRVYNNSGGNNGDAWVTAKALYDGAQNRKLKYSNQNKK